MHAVFGEMQPSNTALGMPEATGSVGLCLDCRAGTDGYRGRHRGRHNSDLA